MQTVFRDVPIIQHMVITAQIPLRRLHLKTFTISQNAGDMYVCSRNVKFYTYAGYNGSGYYTIDEPGMIPFPHHPLDF